MSECLSGWYRGATCDHVYDDCPARQRGKPEMVRVGWWDAEPLTSIPLDVHGTDVCGLCVHRHNRAHHAQAHRNRPRGDEEAEVAPGDHRESARPAERHGRNSDEEIR